VPETVSGTVSFSPATSARPSVTVYFLLAPSAMLLPAARANVTVVGSPSATATVADPLVDDTRYGPPAGSACAVTAPSGSSADRSLVGTLKEAPVVSDTSGVSVTVAAPRSPAAT